MPKYTRVCLVCQKVFTSTYIDRCFTCSTSCRAAHNNHKRAGTLEERFWRKVDKTSSPNGCWLWTGSKHPRGYGTFRVGKTGVRAHKIAYELVLGEIPEGNEICHNCPGGDNPNCVNPYHVFLGNHRENMLDMVRKGRHGLSPKAKHSLTVSDIPLIREYRAKGWLYKDIAALFDVSDRTIGKIIRGERWSAIE